MPQISVKSTEEIRESFKNADFEPKNDSNTILAKKSKTVALKHFKAYHQVHFQKKSREQI